MFWPTAPPPPPPPATEEQRLRIGLFLRQEIFLDRVAHFERSRLRRAGRQAELHLHAPLILAGQEAAGQPQEQHGEQHEDDRVEAKEKPFAVDHRGDAADIAVHHVVEACVEPVLGAFEPCTQMRGKRLPVTASSPCCLGLSRLEVSAGLRISATSTDSAIADTMVTENWR